MDDMLRNKFRTYGSFFAVLVVGLTLLLLMIQFKEKKVTALKLKVIYSEMAQVLSNSYREHGLPSTWGLKEGYKNTEILNKNFFSAFHKESECLTSNENCLPENNYKSIISKKTDLNLSKVPAIKTASGVAIAIDVISSCKNPNEVCANIFVDLNGSDKPNALGKDLFLFRLVNNTTAILPYGSNLIPERLKNDTEQGCNKKAPKALYCTALIMQNSWEIPADYPW